MIFRWLHHKFVRLNHHVWQTNAAYSDKEPQKTTASVASHGSSSSRNRLAPSNICPPQVLQELPPNATPSPGGEEQLAKGRLSGKVFPSQRGVAAAAQARSNAVAPVETPRSIRLRRFKCIFSVIQSSFRRPWTCRSRRKNTPDRRSVRMKCTGFPKILVKLRKRACCMTSCIACSTTGNHAAPVSIKAANPDAVQQTTSVVPSQPQQPDQRPVASPQKPSVQRSLDTSDPEYWIKSNSDYVDLVMTSDVKDSKK